MQKKWTTVNYCLIISSTGRVDWPLNWRTDMNHISAMKAQKAFIQRNAEITTLLARLTQEADNHFGADFDTINYGDVGSLDHIAEQLKEISDQTFNEGEYA